MSLNADMTKAFAPFYEDRAEVSGVRPSGRFRGTFACCLFFGENADALDDNLSSSESTLLTAMIARRGYLAWNQTFAPQAGDKVILPNGTTFAVKSVDAFHEDYYKLEAREVKSAR